MHRIRLTERSGSDDVHDDIPPPHGPRVAIDKVSVLRKALDDRRGFNRGAREGKHRIIEPNRRAE